MKKYPTADSDVEFYGVGVVQQIDAAAMELYLGWRRYETEISGTGDLAPSQASGMVRASLTSSPAVPASGSDKALGLTLHDLEEPPHRAALFYFLGSRHKHQAALPLVKTQC